MSSDFHGEVDENCALMGYYAASSDVSGRNIGPLFRGFSTPE